MDFDISTANAARDACIKVLMAWSSLKDQRISCESTSSLGVGKGNMGE